MKIIKKCPVCNKTAEIDHETKVAGLVITHYLCGHVRTAKELKPKDLSLKSSDNKTPYNFQLEGASWAIKGNARVLIADEMGLGKTIQSLLVAHSDPLEYVPLLAIVKASLKVQWQKEALRWAGWLFQIIESEDDYLLTNVNGYIIAYDTLAYSEFKNKRGKLVTRGMKDASSWIKKINPRLIILDECQSIKNTEAKRTKAVQMISRDVPHLIALSGTPILNNAAEYFPVLNMIQPEKFPNKAAYIQRWCDSYFSMKGGVQKVGGIRDIKGFKAFTEDFVIRRTRAEVLPDLPTIDRRFRFEELGEKVEEAYIKLFEEFKQFYFNGSNGQSNFQRDGNILAYLSKMRHLTGIAKIPGVVDFIQEFIETTDRKIVVFTHHIDVAREVVQRLNTLFPSNVVYVPSPVDPTLIEKFREENSRILIGNTLSLGEGHNLQCCSDFILMEREWNPPKEEQAEGRFPRPGQTSDKITGTYFTAVGTVDEFFAELVEQKRAIVSSVLDGKELKWNESALITELAEVLAMKGGKRWNL
jgi:SWI/SNF-related matrix-associated actin-dependent regulator 1 of chromatin subfamily A